MTHDTTWMKLESIVLSETSQKQRKKYYMIPFTFDPTRVIKFIETGSRIVATRKQGEGRIGNYYLLGTAFHSVEILQVLEMGSDDCCSTM